VENKVKITDPIKNDEQVVAYTKEGKEIPYRFGQLKQDFQSKKIKEEIACVTIKRTKESFYVTMHPTKGVKFKKV
jgi:hypothetical protein